jgi:hypothetical protein
MQKIDEKVEKLNINSISGYGFNGDPMQTYRKHEGDNV